MEELLNAVECVANEDDHHIVKEPISLLCGHCICKECILKNVAIVSSRTKCKTKNTIDLNNSSVSCPTQHSITSNIQMLIHHVKNKFDSLSDQVTG